jgi:ABC-2 family transporter protein
MIELPLAARELTRRGKQKWTYGLRSVVASVAAFIIVTAGMMGAGTSPEQALDYLGGVMTSLSSAFQFAVVFLLAPMLAAETIVREKENRTLALLLMADLRGGDIYAAKFLSVFLWAELLMLSTLPLLAFASAFGGVTVPAVVLQLFLLTVALAAVCVIGILCSTITHTFTESLLLTAGLEGLWLWGFYQVDRLAAGQGLPIKTSFTWVVDLSGPQVTLVGSLPVVTVTLVVFALLARLTVLLLPRQAYEPVARRTRRGWRILPLNPAAKLVSETATGLGARLRSWPMRLIAAIGLVLIACIPVYGVLVILFVMTYDITSSLKGVQKGGVLDDLWITPLSNKALARAMFRAYFDRSLLYWPAFVAGQVAILHGTTAGRIWSSWPLDQGGSASAVSLAGAFVLLILLALMQVCCIVGLSCRSAATPIRSPLGQAVAVVMYFLTYSFFGAMNAFAGTGALMWLLSKTPIPMGHPLAPMVLFWFCALFLYGLAASVAYVWFLRDFSNLAGEGRPAPEKAFRDRTGGVIINAR